MLARLRPLVSGKEIRSLLDLRAQSITVGNGWCGQMIRSMPMSVYHKIELVGGKRRRNETLQISPQALLANLKQFSRYSYLMSRIEPALTIHGQSLPLSKTS